MIHWELTSSFKELLKLRLSQASRDWNKQWKLAIFKYMSPACSCGPQAAWRFPSMMLPVLYLAFLTGRARNQSSKRSCELPRTNWAAHKRPCRHWLIEAWHLAIEKDRWSSLRALFSIWTTNYFPAGLLLCTAISLFITCRYCINTIMLFEVYCWMKLFNIAEHMESIFTCL